MTRDLGNVRQGGQGDAEIERWNQCPKAQCLGDLLKIPTEYSFLWQVQKCSNDPNLIQIWDILKGFQMNTVSGGQ